MMATFSKWQTTIFLTGILLILLCFDTMHSLPVNKDDPQKVISADKGPFQDKTLRFHPSDNHKVKTWVSHSRTARMEMAAVRQRMRKDEQKADRLGDVGGVLKTVECDVCKLLVTAVQSLVAQGKSQNDIIAALTTLCIDLHIEDQRVCSYVIREFKDEVLSVVEDLALSPPEVCGLVLGGDCGPVYNPFGDWNVTLPNTPKPPVTPPVPPKTGSKKIRIIQLSDIHVDLNYKSGSNAECGEPVCCHENDGKVKGTPAGHWGDYRQCDTPTWTLENVLNRIATEEEFDYIYWTGDLPGHVVWNQTREQQQKLEKYLTALFLKYFPNTPIFPSVGNHESAPVNSFPPPFVKGDQSIQWLYQTLASNWSQWLPNSSLPDILLGGYYTVLVQPGFRIVSMNTNYCSNQNWWLLLNTTDPAGELQWLITVLQAAEDNKEKVHILGHIPTGTDTCLKAWSWNYFKIINRYESTVTGQFFGHTHTDYVTVYYDDVTFERPVGVGYVSPSVTPYASGYGTNPSYRVYTVDGGYPHATWEVLNHQTYMFNLTVANLSPSLPPTWYLEYDAKVDYNMTSVYPADWHNLLKQMETDDRLFNKYYQYYYHGHPPTPTCDAGCRHSKLCEARCGRSHDQGRLCKDIPAQDH